MHLGLGIPRPTADLCNNAHQGQCDGLGRRCDHRRRGKIVDSIVGDLIMPIVGKVTGGLDFSNYYIPLNNQAAGMALEEAKKAGAVIAYGNFITILINFIIFMMVKQMNRLRREAPPAEPEAPPEEVALLREIRDSLQKANKS